MAKFEVKTTGLKDAVSMEETIAKNLQKEIENLNAVISSAALNKAGYGDVLGALRTIADQVKNEKRATEELKNCLSEAISLYEKTEDNLAQGGVVNNKIKKSIEKLGELLDALLKEEKYGENDGCEWQQDMLRI